MVKLPVEKTPKREFELWRNVLQTIVSICGITSSLGR